MTKQELVTAILKDMHDKASIYYTANDHKAIDKRWKGWLARQNKAELETIYTNRKAWNS